MVRREGGRWHGGKEGGRWQGAVMIMHIFLLQMSWQTLMTFEKFHFLLHKINTFHLHLLCSLILSDVSADSCWGTVIVSHIDHLTVT